MSSAKWGQICLELKVLITAVVWQTAGLLTQVSARSNSPDRSKVDLKNEVQSSLLSGASFTDMD